MFKEVEAHIDKIVETKKEIRNTINKQRKEELTKHLHKLEKDLIVSNGLDKDIIKARERKKRSQEILRKYKEQGANK